MDRRPDKPAPSPLRGEGWDEGPPWRQAAILTSLERGATASPVPSPHSSPRRGEEAQWPVAAASRAPSPRRGEGWGEGPPWCQVTILTSLERGATASPVPSPHSSPRRGEEAQWPVAASRAPSPRRGEGWGEGTYQRQATILPSLGQGVAASPVPSPHSSHQRGEEAQRPAAAASCACPSGRGCAKAPRGPQPSANPKNATAAAVLCAAVVSALSPRSRAISSQMCFRYIGSLRRCEGCGRTVRGSR